MLIVGSEAGMVKLDEETSSRRAGRAGPEHRRRSRRAGSSTIRTARHAGGAPALRRLDAAHHADRPDRADRRAGAGAASSGEALRRRQLGVGITLEELEMILHPMVEDAAEAIGSMGDDTPIAVLSEQYRGLHHYFRQNFAQVTNPPIDSLRETRVMSLKTRLGNLGNVLDEDAEPVRPAAARQPGAVQRRVRRHARTMGDAPASWTAPSRRRRRGRPAPGARAHPPRGRGGRARRLHPCHPDRRGAERRSARRSR